MRLLDISRFHYRVAISFCPFPYIEVVAVMAPVAHIWRLFALIELKESMRQKGDTTFVDILNAFRIVKLKAGSLQKVSRDANSVFSIEFELHTYHNPAVFGYYKAKNIQIVKIKAHDQLVSTT